MTAKRCMQTGAFALATIAAVFAAPILSAQTRPALVKNIDEKGRVPYQYAAQCPFAATCIVKLPAVPVGKRLVIEYVNASYANTSHGLPNATLSTDVGASGIFFNLPAVVVRTYLLTIYAVSSQVLIYVEAGQQPSISADTDTGYVGVTGYLVDLTQ